MAKRRFTDSEESEIGKIYEIGGFPVSRLAKAYGTCNFTVQELLRRQGIERRSPSEAWKLSKLVGRASTRRIFTDSEEAEIAKLYSVGRIGASRLSEAYDCEVSTITRLLHRQGVTRDWFTPTYTMWKGKQGRLDYHGYVMIAFSRLDGVEERLARESCSSSVACQVHRLVMAIHLDRPLTKHEIVHHKDGNRQNNELSNLELLTRRTHHHGYGSPYYQQLQEALSENKRLKVQIETLQGGR